VPEQLLTVNQAAAFLGLHPKTLYQWVQSRRIPFVQLGSRNIRFRREDLIAFVESQTVPAR
jgi:excisionase family DNA binding protein